MAIYVTSRTNTRPSFKQSDPNLVIREKKGYQALILVNFISLDGFFFLENRSFDLRGSTFCKRISDMPGSLHSVFNISVVSICVTSIAHAYDVNQTNSIYKSEVTGQLKWCFTKLYKAYLMQLWRVEYGPKSAD